MAEIIVDPVCHVRLDPVYATREFVYNERMYYFCSDRCLEIFQQDPERYADPAIAGEYGQEAHGEELEEPTVR